MTADISTKRVAFLLTNGVEQVELTSPWQAVVDAGGSPTLISPQAETVTAMNSDWEHGDTFNVDVQLTNANPDDYDALVVPGGTLNADRLRIDTDAQVFVRAFFEAQKPVGVICHGPWILINAGVASGRNVTSFWSLSTDLRNAGANWSDQEVVVDSGLVTSRYPGDLQAFNAKLLEEIAEGKHQPQTV